MTPGSPSVVRGSWEQIPTERRVLHLVSYMGGSWHRGTWIDQLTNEENGRPAGLQSGYLVWGSGLNSISDSMAKYSFTFQLP